MNEINDFSTILLKTYKNIESNAFKENNKLMEVWKKVVISIKSFDSSQPLGKNLYDHSEIVETKYGTLLIEVDHPGYIQMFKMNEKYIVRGLKMYAPELNIESLAFKLKGSNAFLCNVDYEKELNKEKRILEEKYRKDEEILKKFEKTTEKSNADSELPKELADIFERMKKLSDK